MLTLGIESSCDETAASVLLDGRKILSSIVASQDNIHAKYGGVVPELASRRHLEAIIPVIKKALCDANIKITEVDCIAVTKGPGLVGSLLVGLSAAKALSFCHKIPLVGVNHIEAHLRAVELEENAPVFPCVGLVVSGGHTNLYYLKSLTGISLLGKTRDDAAGEAFDKTAKVLDLGYPGGVQIEKISEGVDPNEIKFPRPFLEKGSLDFSFSGLKTAVVNLYKKSNGNLSMDFKKKISAGFQEAIVDTLIHKLLTALSVKNCASAIICGGVAANQRLRDKIEEKFQSENLKFYIPRKSLCTDNAAMVAMAGFINFKAGKTEDLKLNANANLEIF